MSAAPATERVLMAMSTFDVVVTVMLGSVAGRVIMGHPPTLTSGILGLATLFVLEAGFGQLRSSLRVQRFMNSPARLLMIGPQIQDKATVGAEREHLPDGIAVSLRLPPPVFGVGLIEVDVTRRAGQGPTAFSDDAFDAVADCGVDALFRRADNFSNAVRVIGQLRSS